MGATNNKSIYEVINLMNGDRVTFIIPTFGEISQTITEYNNQTKEGAFDITMFFAKNICLFNGKKKDIEYISQLNCDAYWQISEVIGKLLKPLM